MTVSPQVGRRGGGGYILSVNKKVHTATTKLRTTSFQAGEGDVTTGSKDIVSRPKIFQAIFLTV